MFLFRFLTSVAAILIFKMSDQQRTILEVIFRILILKNMDVDTKITLLGALKLILFKTLDSVDAILKMDETRWTTTNVRWWHVIFAFWGPQ